MLNKNELLKIMCENALYIYETANKVEMKSTIEFMNIDLMIEFAKNQKINTFFYHYYEMDEEDMIIDEDVIKKLRLDEDAITILNDQFDEYNRKVENMDFSRPVLLEIYCIYQGVLYSVKEYDYWFLEEGIEFPEITALKMATEYMEEIAKEKMSNQQRIAEEREKLKIKIMQDEEFRNCTNKTLRRSYATKLFSENGQLQKLFYSCTGMLRDVTIIAFVEQIWKEYKNNYYKK